MPKGKTAHHTAKGLKRKADLKKRAKMPKGAAGVNQRQEKQVKKAYQCYICAKVIPDEKTLNIHWDSKHPKLKMDLEKCKMKEKKESTKGLKRKADLKKRAKMPKGAAGVNQRQEKQVKKAYQCYICAKVIPDEKTLNIHWDSKHPKLKMDLEKCKMKEKKESNK
eukprot:CAMPEP_0197081522 /NCGR_PEP_ID=MMETSP1384-20130603/214677_1 /TAXON_ID=29189 /ORGANISM="Ammonia sp." /LENGTH=164 /DNA_ID=CAMNT_0042520417 /DNA_START=95 /DNA_END=590 /DNA_ORIENTATION=-